RGHSRSGQHPPVDPVPPQPGWPSLGTERSASLSRRTRGAVAVQTRAGVIPAGIMWWPQRWRGPFISSVRLNCPAGWSSYGRRGVGTGWYRRSWRRRRSSMTAIAPPAAAATASATSRTIRRVGRPDEALSWASSVPDRAAAPGWPWPAPDPVTTPELETEVVPDPAEIPVPAPRKAEVSFDGRLTLVAPTASTRK